MQKPAKQSRVGSRIAERGKAGVALLMWVLGVPGLAVLLYLIFA